MSSVSGFSMFARGGGLQFDRIIIVRKRIIENLFIAGFEKDK